VKTVEIGRFENRDILWHDSCLRSAHVASVPEEQTMIEEDISAEVGFLHEFQIGQFERNPDRR
jgi:hypothetical protein